MGEGEGHGGQALGGRVDEHHGVLLPQLAGQLVPHTAPQVDHLLAVVIGAAGTAQFAPPSEVLDERLAHRLQATADVPLNFREPRRPIAHRLRPFISHECFCHLGPFRTALDASQVPRFHDAVPEARHRQRAAHGGVSPATHRRAR